MIREPIYCTRCVYPVNTVNLNIDEQGVCSACRVAEEFDKLDDTFWSLRKKKFENLLDGIERTDANYDCLIPVSGGKDS